MEKVEMFQHQLEKLNGLDPAPEPQPASNVVVDPPTFNPDVPNPDVSRVDQKEYNKFLNALHKERIKKLADKRDLTSSDTLPVGEERKVLFKSTVNGAKKKSDRLVASLKRGSSKREEKVNHFRAKMLEKVRTANNPVTDGATAPESVQPENPPAVNTDILAASIDHATREEDQSEAATDTFAASIDHATREEDRAEAALGLASLLNQDRTLYDDISGTMNQLQQDLQDDVNEFGELVAFMTADDETGDDDDDEDDGTAKEDDDANEDDGEKSADVERSMDSDEGSSSDGEEVAQGRGWRLFG